MHLRQAPHQYPEPGVALVGPSGAIQREQALACVRPGRVSRIAYGAGRLGAGKSGRAVLLAAESEIRRRRRTWSRRHCTTPFTCRATARSTGHGRGGSVARRWSCCGRSRPARATWRSRLTSSRTASTNWTSCAASAAASSRCTARALAEVAVARYNARPRHEVHWLKTAAVRPRWTNTTGRSASARWSPWTHPGRSTSRSGRRRSPPPARQPGRLTSRAAGGHPSAMGFSVKLRARVLAVLPCMRMPTGSRQFAPNLLPHLGIPRRGPPPISCGSRGRRPPPVAAVQTITWGGRANSHHRLPSAHPAAANATPVN